MAWNSGSSRLRVAAWAMAVSCACPAIGSAQAIILLPHWQPEQVRRIEMVTETRKLSGRSETLLRRVRRLTDLRVTSVDQKTILMTWTDRDYEVSTQKGPVADPPIEVFKNEPIELTLTSRGQLIELRNWETVRRMILKAQDKIDATAKAAGRNEEQLKQSRAALEQSLANEELVRATWANREGTYFYFYGLNVPAEGALESEQEVTLPISGARMACNARITATLDPADKDVAHFHFEKIIDAEQAAAKVRTALQELAQRSGRDPAKTPVPKVEIIDRIDAQANLLSGWVLSLDQYRKTVVSGTPVAQIETISFKMLERTP